MNKELLKGLTEEQLNKMKACKTKEELLSLAKEEDIELTDEQMEAVSGGCGTPTAVPCPNCGTTDVYFVGQNLWYEKEWKCNKCDHRFWTK